jgi:hypothetical protein
MGRARQAAVWTILGVTAAISPICLIISLNNPTGLYRARFEFKDSSVAIFTRQLSCSNGAILFFFGDVRMPPVPPKVEAIWRKVSHDGWKIRHDLAPNRRLSTFLGFAANIVRTQPRPGWFVHEVTLCIPLWFPTLIGAIPLLRRLARSWVTKDRASKSSCIVCGYDLRESTDRCPECGAVACEQQMATDVGPAVVAVATSSGTKCIVLMALYMASIVVCVILAVKFDAPLYYPAALAILMLGSFHAAGYSRSIEAFFGCGAMCSLMLWPLYMNFSRSARLQMIAVVCAIVTLGVISSSSAALRWRRQDRDPATPEGDPHLPQAISR